MSRVPGLYQTPYRCYYAQTNYKPACRGRNITALPKSPTLPPPLGDSVPNFEAYGTEHESSGMHDSLCQLVRVYAAIRSAKNLGFIRFGRPDVVGGLPCPYPASPLVRATTSRVPAVPVGDVTATPVETRLSGVLCLVRI